MNPRLLVGRVLLRPRAGLAKPLGLPLVVDTKRPNGQDRAVLGSAFGNDRHESKLAALGGGANPTFD